MSFSKTILITGGAGFIGSHVVRRFVKNYPDYNIVNLDKLTYAGNLLNLIDVDEQPNYQFVKGDIVDAACISQLFLEHQFDAVIHLAAESHVDRSIGRATIIKSVFIMYQPMKSMAHWEIPECLPKKPNMTRIAHTLHQKLHLIILCGLIMTPMAWMWSSPIVPIITAPIIFLKS
jgi:hypothetical protein